MKVFLKYFIVMVLLIGVLWSNDRPAQYGTISNMTIATTVSSIKEDFKSVKRELVSFRNMIKFVENLPIK